MKANGHAAEDVDTRLKPLLEGTAGNVTIIYSVAFAVLAGIAGIAIDFARSELRRAELQGAADSAALAGVNSYINDVYTKKKGQGDSSTRATTTIDNYIVQNTPDYAAKVAVSFSSAPPSAEVKLSEFGRQTLSAMIGAAPVDIHVTAKAIASTKSDAACVIALDSSASPGITFKMSGSMRAEGCAVWSNSSQSISLEGSGSGVATATQFCAAGGAVAGTISFSVPPESNCPPVKDPFANTEMPAVGACSFTDFNAGGGGTVYLDPGVYCGGIKFTGQADIQLAPGVYVVKDGPFTMVGGSTVTGSGVTFVLTGTDAGLKFGGASSIHITGPTSGAYAGIAIFGDRTSPVTTSELRGANSLDIEGVIYLPNQDLTFSGNNSTNLPANYTVLIARTVTFDGSSEVGIRSNFDASSVPVPPEILQQRIVTRLAR